MQLNNEFTRAFDILRSPFSRQRRPIFVSWALTNKCPHSCPYCHISQKKNRELSTEESLLLLSQLKESGCKVISFTGGEPLLRPDLKDILARAKKLSIYTYLCSTGYPAPSDFSFLDYVDCLNISIDGPLKVHDSIRVPGSFEAATGIIVKALGKKIKVEIQAVLSERNLDSIDFLLDFSHEYRVKLYFQPATIRVLGGSQINPIACEEESYRRAIDSLIEHKGKGASIGNSLAGLRAMRSWPKRQLIKCPTSKVFCYIQPGSNIKLCPRLNQSMGPILGKDIIKILNDFPEPQCQECWCCQKIELIEILKANPEAIINAIFSR